MVEARRLGIRFVWAYVILGLLVAISVTFPLFLLARERRLALSGTTGSEIGLGRGDTAGLGVLAVVAAVFTLWTAAR